jgi:hypothetical protein
MPKIVMTEREYKNLETGEESWTPMWDTNLDSLDEAVTYMETLGHYVISAFIDWGNAPCVVMARGGGGEACMFLGHDEDLGWFRRLQGKCGEVYPGGFRVVCTLLPDHGGDNHEDHEFCEPEVWSWAR